MDNFNGLRLQPALLHALGAMNFKTPTPIQAAAIPAALEGHDILGTAQTGTGKTGAFGIPLISHLLAHPESQALVMTPTRELATQVIATLHLFLGKTSRVPTALLIGGAAYGPQFDQLRRMPRLIVGTPGRITDHLKRKSLSLTATDFLVLDETDRMLDMGFGVQIDEILSFMPNSRQTLLFSATLPTQILKLSGRYLRNPVRISTGITNAPAALVKQEKIDVRDDEKYPRLLKELDAREGTIIIFVKTKSSADRLSKKLRGQNHQADALHGDLRQNQRDRAIKAFKNFETRIMVATDIAARGLDIPHIEHVINYDLPQVAEDYIHRIGRTARNGAEGIALSLVTADDGKKWQAIQRLLNPRSKEERAEHAPRSGKSFGSKRKGSSAPAQRRRKPFDASAPAPHQEAERPHRAPAQRQRKPFDASAPAPHHEAERPHRALATDAPAKSFSKRKGRHKPFDARPSERSGAVPAHKSKAPREGTRDRKSPPRGMDDMTFAPSAKPAQKGPLRIKRADGQQAQKPKFWSPKKPNAGKKRKFRAA